MKLDRNEFCERFGDMKVQFSSLSSGLLFYHGEDTRGVKVDVTVDLSESDLHSLVLMPSTDVDVMLNWTPEAHTRCHAEDADGYEYYYGY